VKRRLLSSVSLRGLHGKLTITYTLVTVAFLLGVELLIIGLSQVLYPRLFSLPAAGIMATRVAPQARRFFECDPPDALGLSQWLAEGAHRGFVVSVEHARFHRFTPLGLFFDDWRLLVFDRFGHLVAMAPSPSVEAAGTPIGPLSVPGMKSLWPVALSGETRPSRLYVHTSEGRLTIAVPIVAEEGPTLGILAVTGSSAEAVYPSLVDLTRVLGRSLIPFTLAAGVVGLVFGFLAARGLSRRLASLSEAANSWSEGDFGVTVEDRSYDELGQLTRRLNDMAAQLKTLLRARQQLAMIEERNRLARDLHDTVKQEAFALSAQLSAAQALIHRDPGAAELRLVEAERLADQIRRELSGLIQELRPLDLQRRGLVAALREYVEDWGRQYRIRARVVAPAEVSLPEPIEEALYRVVQEALSNAARHSKASEVEVRLDIRDTMVTLVMADNGHGFDVAGAQGSGLGLRSMEERVAPFGKLSVQSSPGRGTTVRARFDLPEDDSG
jgi:signal transduction histidine kinase